MIAVLGSINIDLVSTIPRFPKPGETLISSSFTHYPGGKGANQAVAAARLKAKVSFFGKVGADPFGGELIKALEANGIEVEAVVRETHASSGTASIWVTNTGENAIAYTPGANSTIDRVYVDRVLPQLSIADVILLQLEIPVNAVAYLLQALPPDRPLVILDPAPVQDISHVHLSRVDIITPNRGELFSLTGESKVDRAGHKLLERGVKKIICKDGSNGSYLIDQTGVRHFPPCPVRAVDTTAAGDAFNGALAVFLARGKPVEEAIRWANAAGALATTRRGAQPSLPTLSELEEFFSSCYGRQ